MCRRTLTHYMHHDVRTPMVLDPSVEDAPVFANPRHTRFHKCELCRTTDDQWLLNKPLNLCEYHSCCVQIRELEFCNDFLAVNAASIEGDCEPELCPNYGIEHRHERLPYFGLPEEYPEGFCPAEWRGDMSEVGNDWRDLWFLFDIAQRPKLEREMFTECEKLYTLEQDAKTQFLVYRDLSRLWPREHFQMLSAKFNVEQAQSLLLEQKERVSGWTNWAISGIPGNFGAFTPTWWMRMWALDNEVYEE